MKKSKKNKVINKIKDVLNSYKTIIWISFLINIILLIFSYHVISSNKLYTFSGSDDYLKVEDGLIHLSTDINVLSGNNIKYVNDTDYEVKEFKIGYYVMDNNKLVEIISTDLNLDSSIKISELIDNFTTFNIVEKDNNKYYFTNYKKNLIKDGLYLVMEAKSVDDKEIVSKVNLNVSKISKH